MVEKDDLSDLLSFVFEVPSVQQSDWDGQVGYILLLQQLFIVPIDSG